MAKFDGEVTATASSVNCAAPLRIGTSIGRYVVESVLARGGFAWTYLVGDSTLGRRLVAKELCPMGTVRDDTRVESAECERFGQLLELFRTECAALAQLPVHPNVVTVHDVVDANGTSYLLSQYVPSVGVGALTFPETGAVLLQLADALGHLHAANVVHRDVKPDNVLITAAPSGWAHSKQAVLIDFGSALTHRAQHPASNHSPRFVTPGFSAPEACSQDELSTPTALDVFGFGATGRFLLAQGIGDRTEASQAPLDSLFIECMSPHPVDRPAIAEVRDRLGRLLSPALDRGTPGAGAVGHSMTDLGGSATTQSSSAFWEDLRSAGSPGGPDTTRRVLLPDLQAKKLRPSSSIGRRLRKLGAHDE